MTTQITLTLQDNRKTTKTRVTSIVKRESIYTKYGDIGTAQNNYKIMKAEEKENKEEGYSVQDYTRAGVVKQIFLGKSEKELIEFTKKQCNDLLVTLKKEDKGMKHKMEIKKL